MAQELARARAVQVDHRHVRDVEHTCIATHRMVFPDLRAVVDRHVPAAEVDHLRAERPVGFIEDGLVGHGGDRGLGRALSREVAVMSPPRWQPPRSSSWRKPGPSDFRSVLIRWFMAGAGIHALFRSPPRRAGYFLLRATTDTEIVSKRIVCDQHLRILIRSS